MLWEIVVLIPKGKGQFCGIRLLEPIWKVVEILLERRLRAIKFHDSLHGSIPGRGTGTGIIEAKLAQQLAYIKQ